MHMNRIRERLYLETMLDCEGESCDSIYAPDTQASDPMDEWASRNSNLADLQGWKIDHSGKVLCSSCAKAL
jgi:hypothetical protein